MILGNKGNPNGDQSTINYKTKKNENNKNKS